MVGTANTGRLINAAGSYIRIHDLKDSGAVHAPATNAMAGIFVMGGQDIWIEKNTLAGNGNGSEGYDIVAYTTGNSRIHMRNNQISNSFTQHPSPAMTCRF